MALVTDDRDATRLWHPWLRLERLRRLLRRPRVRAILRERLTYGGGSCERGRAPQTPHGADAAPQPRRFPARLRSHRAGPPLAADSAMKAIWRAIKWFFAKLPEWFDAWVRRYTRIGEYDTYDFKW